MESTARAVRDDAAETSELSPREQARRRLESRREFTSHLVAYVVINAFLVGIWLTTGAGYFWPLWVLGGWGVGLLLHAWETFFRRPITAADIEEEMHRGR